jgi:hypothetical protein
MNTRWITRPATSMFLFWASLVILSCNFPSKISNVPIGEDIAEVTSGDRTEIETGEMTLFMDGVLSTKGGALGG